MDKNFGGVIWTNHALQRLQERGIRQGDAWTAWRNPDKSRYAATQGAWVHYKTWGGEKIEVVAKQNDKKEWVILSVWSKPVCEQSFGRNYREKDEKKVPLWRKILRKIVFLTNY